MVERAIKMVTSFTPADFAVTTMLFRVHDVAGRCLVQNLTQLVVVHLDVPSLFAPSVRSIHIL